MNVDQNVLKDGNVKFCSTIFFYLLNKKQTNEVMSLLTLRDIFISNQDRLENYQH